MSDRDVRRSERIIIKNNRVLGGESAFGNRSVSKTPDLEEGQSECSIDCCSDSTLSEDENDEFESQLSFDSEEFQDSKEGILFVASSSHVIPFEAPLITDGVTHPNGFLPR